MSIHMGIYGCAAALADGRVAEWSLQTDIYHVDMAIVHLGMVIRDDIAQAVNAACDTAYVVVTSYGRAFGWGDDTYGQLGNGSGHLANGAVRIACIDEPIADITGYAGGVAWFTSSGDVRWMAVNVDGLPMGDGAVTSEREGYGGSQTYAASMATAMCPLQ